MAFTFYPHEDELDASSIDEKLEILLSSAERFKAAVLDTVIKPPLASGAVKKGHTPRDLTHSYNWDEIASLLSEIRALPEGTSQYKLVKADKLTKLAAIYEVLRGAKMPKLEAVRLALMNEANQLKGNVGPA